MSPSVTATYRMLSPRRANFAPCKSAQPSEARAREVAVYRQGLLDKKRTTSAPVTLENMFADKSSKIIEFPIVIRGDVQGSTEAIVNAVNRISTDEIKVRVLSAGVGAITEGDVTLANATGAPIIGFNVRPNAKAREAVNRTKVELRYYDVIYHLTDWVREAMAGQLGPEIIETVVGRAEVKDVFPAGKRDKAAGLLVLEGIMRKGLHARLTREDVIVSKTTISSLRRFKDDVAEVRAGMECGVLLADTNDIKAGDNLEVFEVEERARTLYAAARNDSGAKRATLRQETAKRGRPARSDRTDGAGFTPAPLPQGESECARSNPRKAAMSACFASANRCATPWPTS